MRSSRFSPLALLSVVALACSLVSLPFSGTVTGSGHATQQTRPVSGFTEVDFRTTGEAIITVGGIDSVVVEADDNLLPFLRTDVVGRQLVISRPANTKISTRNPIRFTITVKAIDYASMSGTGDMKIDGLDSGLLRLVLSGTGTITAYGKVETLEARLSGTGLIKCGELEADTVIANHSGNGEMTVRAAHSLDANISGVGAIHYYGDPEEVAKTITGHGTINEMP